MASSATAVGSARLRLVRLAGSAWWALLLSSLVLAAVAVAGVLTFPLLDGDGASHARQHLGGTAAGAIAAAAVAVLWRPRALRPSQLARLALAASLWIFSLAQLGESLGAFGYDEFNVGSKHRRLTDVHGFFNGVTTLSILFVLISVGLSLLAAAVWGWRRTRGSCAEQA